MKRTMTGFIIVSGFLLLQSSFSLAGPLTGIPGSEWMNHLGPNGQVNYSPGNLADIEYAYDNWFNNGKGFLGDLGIRTLLHAGTETGWDPKQNASTSDWEWMKGQLDRRALYENMNDLGGYNYQNIQASVQYAKDQLGRDISEIEMKGIWEQYSNGQISKWSTPESYRGATFSDFRNRMIGEAGTGSISAESKVEGLLKLAAVAKNPKLGDGTTPAQISNQYMQDAGNVADKQNVYQGFWNKINKIGSNAWFNGNKNEIDLSKAGRGEFSESLEVEGEADPGAGGIMFMGVQLFADCHVFSDPNACNHLQYGIDNIRSAYNYVVSHSKFDGSLVNSVCGTAWDAKTLACSVNVAQGLSITSISLPNWNAPLAAVDANLVFYGSPQMACNGGICSVQASGMGDNMASTALTYNQNNGTLQILNTYNDNSQGGWNLINVKPIYGPQQAAPIGYTGISSDLNIPVVVVQQNGTFKTVMPGAGATLANGETINVTGGSNPTVTVVDDAHKQTTTNNPDGSTTMDYKGTKVTTLALSDGHGGSGTQVTFPDGSSQRIWKDGTLEQYDSNHNLIFGAKNNTDANGKVTGTTTQNYNTKSTVIVTNGTKKGEDDSAVIINWNTGGHTYCQKDYCVNDNGQAYFKNDPLSNYTPVFDPTSFINDNYGGMPYKDDSGDFWGGVYYYNGGCDAQCDGGSYGKYFK